MFLNGGFCGKGINKASMERPQAKAIVYPDELVESVYAECL